MFFRRAAFSLFLLAAAHAAFARPGEGGLTQIEAERRAALVKNPNYELTLTLDGDKRDFTGHEVLRFTLDAPADLTVDFTGGAIVRLMVNGALVAAPRYAGLFLDLPASSLRAGENVVIVEYTHPYSIDGAGLYRFKDSEDGRVYLYSNVEPYDANKLFPAFDQPDLKAPYRLTVDAPSDWTVISAAPEVSVKPAGERRIWTFGATPKISAYVFSVHAGPYHVWTSTAGAIPLRLFARESMARYVRSEEWFEITRQGLGFYGDYFALPYPFKKYDQLILPDVNGEAMENVAAATFDERFLFRSTPTLEGREDAANTILHEMAHMWFGNLVTMRWWDGLWLNESFATYLSSLATGRATRFRRAWMTFFFQNKLWAYDADRRETSHPVQADVPDTEQAFANFDGITYGKGASALKQLAFIMGEEKFRDGIRAYLKANAYGSAEQRDFFGALASQAPGVDLGAWTHEWLETTGVDIVRADWDCANGLVSSFALVRSSDDGALRSHRTAVALFETGQGGALEVRQRPASVAYAGARTDVAALVGLPCPAVVYPNHGDEDYAVVELDARSLAAVKAGLPNIPDPLTRAMLWRALWETARDAKWPMSEYADLALASLGGETDLKVAAAALATVYGRDPRAPSVLNYLPHPDYPRFEAFFWGNMLKSEPGGDFQKLWLDGYVKSASSEAGAARLRGLLDGEITVKGPLLDQDRRWSIIARLSELGAADAEALIASEAERDPSETGVRSAITARAARPTLASKRVWFDRIADPESTAPLGEQRAAMASFYPRTQAELRGRFVEPFFKTLPRLSALKDGDFLDEYARSMLPTRCTPESADAFGSYAARDASLKPILARALRDARQEEERCVKIRSLLGAHPK